MSLPTRSAIVRVRAATTSGSQHGTGFVAGRGLVVTCLHVVADRQALPISPWPSIEVEFSTGHEPQMATLIDFDPQTDWALLACAVPEAISPLALRPADVDESLERRWWTWGFAELNCIDGVTFEGKIRNLAGSYAKVPAIELHSEEAKGVYVAGLSGAPCLEAGHVIGVIRNTLEENERSMGTLYATGIERVLASTHLARVVQPAASKPGYERLLRVAQTTLAGHLRTLGRYKYTPQLYVPRTATAALSTLGVAETQFRSGVKEVVDRLAQIALVFGLVGAREALAHAWPRLRDSMVLADLERAVDQLDAAFHRRTLEQVRAEMTQAARAPDLHALEATLWRIRQLLARAPVCSDIEALLGSLYEANRSFLTNGSIWLDDALKCLPGYMGASWTPVPEMLASLRAACERFCRRATALVGSAGTGKTNAICAFADTIGQHVPVVVFDGRTEIAEPAVLVRALRDVVERAVAGPVDDWVDVLARMLDGPASWLVFCIDGLDESRDLGRAADALERFLRECEALRIQVVVSCRDVAWEAFHDRVHGFLGDGRPLRVETFTGPEWAAASKIYLERYQIRCVLEPAAQATLRSPLLLRLFCEGHRGKDLGVVADLRPLDVFESYLDAATRRIAARTGALRPASANDLLERVALAYWRARDAVTPRELGVSLAEQESATSLYNLCRSEGLLIEIPTAGADAVAVEFVYAQMAEYLIARCWHRELGSSLRPAHLEERLAETVDAMHDFPAAAGTVVFLDRLRGGDGTIVSRLLRLLVDRGDGVVLRLQATIPQIFNHVAIHLVDGVVIAALLRLEAASRPETRDALAPGILRLLAARPAEPALRDLAARLLGVPLDEIIFPPVRRAAGAAVVDALPQPRHRYHSETRLSALRMLAGQTSPQAIDLVVRGIQQLGQHDLHMSLIAFRALDTAPEAVVFDVIDRYLGQPIAEYRIFAAWLVRQRETPQAATVAVRILTDADHRVHHYALQVFQQHGWGRALVEAACHRLGDAKLRAWHARNLLAVLYRRDRLRPDAGATLDVAQVKRAAARWAANENRAVRIDAYRVLFAVGGPEAVSDLGLQDPDPLVQSLVLRWVSRSSG